MPTPFSKKRPQSADISEAINDLDLVVAQLGNKLDSAKQGFVFKKLSMNGETTEHGVVFQCLVRVLVLEDAWTSCPLFSDNVCLRNSEVLRDGTLPSTLLNNNQVSVSSTSTSSNSNTPPPNLLHERPSFTGRSMSVSSMLRRPAPGNSSKSTSTARPASPSGNGKDNSGMVSPSLNQSSMLASISTRTNKADKEKADRNAAAVVAAAAVTGTAVTSPASPTTSIKSSSDLTLVSSPTTSSLGSSQPQALPDVQPSPSSSTSFKTSAAAISQTPLKWHFGIVGKTLAFITNIAGEYTLSLSVLIPYAHTHSDGPFSVLGPGAIRAIDVPFIPKCAHNTFKFHVKEDGTSWRILTDPPLLPSKAIDVTRTRLSSIVLDEKISVTVGGERDRRVTGYIAEGSLPPAERLRIEWVPVVEDVVAEGLGIRRVKREIVMGAAKVMAVEQRAQVAVAADGMRVSTALEIIMDRTGCGMLMPCLLELAVADLPELPNGNTNAETRSAVNVVKVEGEAVGHWWLAGDPKSLDLHGEEQTQSLDGRRSNHASPSDKSRKKLGRWHSPRLPIASNSSEDDADDETFYRDPPEMYKTSERDVGQSPVVVQPLPKPVANLTNAVSSWSTKTLMDDFTRSGVAQSGLEDSSSGESELMKANGILSEDTDPRRQSDSSSLGSFVGKQHPSESDLLVEQSGIEEDNEQAKKEDEQEEDEKLEVEAEVEIDDDADTEVPSQQSPFPTAGKSLMEEIQTVTGTSKNVTTDMLSSTHTAGSSFTTIYVRLDTAKLKGRGPMVSTRITVDTEMVYFVTEHDGVLAHGELHGSNGLRNRLDGVLVPMVHCRVSGGDEESPSVRRSGTVVVRAPWNIEVQESKKIGLYKEIDIAEALSITAPTADDRGGFEALAKRGGRPILVYRHSSLTSWEDASEDVDEEKTPRLHLSVVRRGVVDEGEKIMPIIAQGSVRVTLVDELGSSARRQHPNAALESKKRAIVRARFDLRDPFVGDGVEHLAVRVPVPSAMVSKVFAFVDGERVDVLRSGEEDGEVDAWKIPLSGDDMERVMGRKRTVKTVVIELGYVVAAEWVWRSANGGRTQVMELELAKNGEEDEDDDGQETEGGALVNLPLPVVLNAMVELYKVDVGAVEGLDCTDFEGGFSQATIPGANASVMSYDEHGSAVMTFQRQFVDPPFDGGVGNRNESLALTLFMSVRKIKMRIDRNIPSLPVSVTDFESEMPVDVKDTPVYVKDTPVYVKDTPVYVKDTPVYVKDTPVYVKDTPVDIKDTPVDIKDTPVDVKDTPVDVKDTPVDVKNMPVDVKDTPVDVKNMPVDVKDTPVDVKDTPPLLPAMSALQSVPSQVLDIASVLNPQPLQPPQPPQPLQSMVDPTPVSKDPKSVPNIAEKVLEKKPPSSPFDFLVGYQAWLQPLVIGLTFFLLFWIAINTSGSNRNNALCRSGTQVQYIPVRVVVTKENGVIFQELDRWPEAQQVGGVKYPDAEGTANNAGENRGTTDSPTGVSSKWGFGTLWKTLEDLMKRILGDLTKVNTNVDTGSKADQAVEETVTGA